MTILPSINPPFQAWWQYFDHMVTISTEMPAPNSQYSARTQITIGENTTRKTETRKIRRKHEKFVRFNISRCRLLSVEEPKLSFIYPPFLTKEKFFDLPPFLTNNRKIFHLPFLTQKKIWSHEHKSTFSWPYPIYGFEHKSTFHDHIKRKPSARGYI